MALLKFGKQMTSKNLRHSLRSQRLLRGLCGSFQTAKSAKEPQKRTQRELMYAFFSALLALLSACGPDNGEIGNYRYRSDMNTQPSFRKQEDPRAPVEGTVPVEGYELPIRDSVSSLRLVNPVRPTASNADSAKFLFEAYCSPCHGLGAKGDGPVAAKFQIPPDLTTPKYRRIPDGYIYCVIRNGRLIMPSYAEALKSHERWLVVNHLRTLQK